MPSRVRSVHVLVLFNHWTDLIQILKGTVPLDPKIPQFQLYP